MGFLAAGAAALPAVIGGTATMGETAAASAALGTVGAGVSAIGTIGSGIAAGNQAAYQAQVAKNNATIASQNAEYASAAGAVQATSAGQKSAATGAAIKVAQAADNIDVNSGSAVDVQASERETGEESALNTENNAVVTAYGYRVNAGNDEAQAGLEETAAAQAPIGAAFGAGGSLLSNASTLPEKYRWMNPTPANNGLGIGVY